MSQAVPDADVSVTLTVNGEQMSVDVAADTRVVMFLRDRLGLTGTKYACEVGVCGVCTVLIDGRPTSSCLTLVVQAEGSEVLTIEGISEREDMQVLLDAFVEEGGFQCGFCTSGQIMSIAGLKLAASNGVTEGDELRHYLAGNLCRCTGYYGIERAACQALR